MKVNTQHKIQQARLPKTAGFMHPFIGSAIAAAALLGPWFCFHGKQADEPVAREAIPAIQQLVDQGVISKDEATAFKHVSSFSDLTKSERDWIDAKKQLYSIRKNRDLSTQESRSDKSDIQVTAN